MFFAAGSGFQVVAQDTTNSPKADNSKTNKMADRPAAVTADNAKNNKSDVKLAADIRKSIVADKSLSTYAHNVKIIVRNGTVTLTGPVRSEEEKKTVVDKATSVAGSAATVNDQITIAPKRSKTSS
jgi:osmotically-inducible protein OsmY